MRLYLVRHAEAVEKADKQKDADRPLTARGREQAAALGEALKARGVAVEAVVTSPLVRAKETAAAVHKGLELSGGEPVETELLSQGELRPRKLLKFLTGVKADGVAAVGHQPDIGAFVEWLIGAEDGSLPLAKAAAACVEFDEEPGKGEGRLLWVVTPEWFLPPVKVAAETTAEA